jgi:LacI family transcriptional regulator
MKKLSIDQVAELAYVSRSVVSRVLNNHQNVSDEARERVMKVVEEHNYQPSSVARGLATNKNYEIGILAPKRSDEALGNGFWSILHLGIFEECIDKGYFVTLSPISTDKNAEINEHILDDRRLDGYLLLTQEITDFVINKFNEQDAPMVIVGHDEQHPELHSIDVDNYLGVQQSTNHLIELGHERIGAIMATPTMKECQERLRGYKTALEKAGLPIQDKYIAMQDYTQKHGYETMKKWIRDGLDITALVCMSDTLAMGALLALNEENIPVPEQFSVVGFDDLPISQYTIPPLTTVKQPIYEKGRQAANMLMKLIADNSGEVTHTNLAPELVVRSSTASPPQ